MAESFFERMIECARDEFPQELEKARKMIERDTNFYLSLADRMVLRRMADVARESLLRTSKPQNGYFLAREAATAWLYEFSNLKDPGRIMHLFGMHRYTRLGRVED